MENFYLKELSEILNANLHNLGSEFDGKELWSGLYNGPNDPATAMLTLRDWHMQTRDNVDKQMTNWMLDSLPFILNPIERLMVRLRFECAIGGLDLLRRSRTPRNLPTVILQASQLEEALLWSLTVFFDFYGAETLRRAAQTFLRGDGTTLVQLNR